MTYLMGWNVLVFLLYGVDKSQAKKSGWRIRERTLLLAAFALGGAGALAGMYVFHHKTRKTKFKLLVPLFLLLNLLVIYGRSQFFLI